MNGLTNLCHNNKFQYKLKGKSVLATQINESVHSESPLPVEEQPTCAPCQINVFKWTSALMHIEVQCSVVEFDKQKNSSVEYSTVRGILTGGTYSRAAEGSREEKRGKNSIWGQLCVGLQNIYTKHMENICCFISRIAQ